MDKPKNIRNMSVIAHVDHGADRFPHTVLAMAQGLASAVPLGD